MSTLFSMVLFVVFFFCPPFVDNFRLSKALTGDFNRAAYIFLRFFFFFCRGLMQWFLYLFLKTSTRSKKNRMMVLALEKMGINSCWCLSFSQIEAKKFIFSKILFIFDSPSYFNFILFLDIKKYTKKKITRC